MRDTLPEGFSHFVTSMTAPVSLLHTALVERFVARFVERIGQMILYQLESHTEYKCSGHFQSSLSVHLLQAEIPSYKSPTRPLFS